MNHIREIIAENALRNRRLETHYDPLTGREACGVRRMVSVEWEPTPVWLPETMLLSPEYRRLRSRDDYRRLRFRHDFEYWCATCVNIRQKCSGRIAPLVLNAPQRRVLRTLEEMRLTDRPIRVVMLKARQWGGSTLVQFYMAWIQSVHRRNWNSLISAHVRNTAAVLRQLYSATLANYPEELWEGDEAPRFRPLTDAPNTRVIAGRGCNVTISSSFSPDSIRGIDLSMAHLTEVAFWQDTECNAPADMLRSIAGTVPLVPLSLIVLESTANGAGNFFHSEWQRAEKGMSNFTPVFVPWHEIEIYRLPVDDPARFVASMTSMEMAMWERGLTLEMICWYRTKLRELGDLSLMQAEYPSDAAEAFVNSASDVFSRPALEALRDDCLDPVAVGDISGRAATGPDALLDVAFTPDAQGGLKVWQEPEPGEMYNRYVVAVDVGGRSRGADWSVIAVFDRAPAGGGGPAVVAQWRGHCDHDILGWKAAAIASWYGNALLVIESNSLDAAAEGPSQYILEELNAVYPNLYVRTIRDNALTPDTFDGKVGFHTNRRTKALIVTMLIAMVREGAYTERDVEAVGEMAVFRQLPSGNFAAKNGFHDDILMTRAIGLYVCATTAPPTSFDFRELLDMPHW